MTTTLDSSGQCPNCGRCPHCGHTPTPSLPFHPWPGYPQPYVGDWPPSPYQPTVIWYTTTTTPPGNYC